MCKKDHTLGISDLLSLLQEAQQGRVVGPLLLLGPS